MSAIAEAPAIALRAPGRARAGSALLTLARRRASLTSKTPRQIAVPLLGPALLAVVVAPALKVATGGLHSHIDYTSFVGVGAVGLVIPLSCISPASACWLTGIPGRSASCWRRPCRGRTSWSGT